MVSDITTNGTDSSEQPNERRDELVAWLDSHTNFEVGMPPRAATPSLDRMRALCDLLGDPQRTSPVIHITGTNGKGSTARIVTELLTASGLSVGTYTSPNLARVNERITRNSEPIDDDDLSEVLDSLRHLEPLLPEGATRFELLTAASFTWFADVAVDVAVIEVGLGGKWDATNVVEPDVSVVTNVSFDHTEVLGPSLADIATEKAGIIKPGSRVILGVTQPDLLALFHRAAEVAGATETWEMGIEFECERSAVAVGGRVLELRTPGARYEEVFLPLHGAHQGDNAACALAAAEAFFAAPLSYDVVEQGMGSVRVPGRLEVLGHSPLVLVDGAHNVGGAEALGRSLSEDFYVEGEIVAVIGLLQGRDPKSILDKMRRGGVRTVVACNAPSPRAIEATAIAEAARQLGIEAYETSTVREAVELAMAKVGTEGMLLVTGSLYVVAEARSLLAGELDGQGRPG